MRCRDASLTHPKRFAPPWGFQEKVPGEEGMALVSPICVNVMFCGAGFRPGRRGPFVSAKGPKTIDAPSGLMGEDGRKLGECGPSRGVYPEFGRRTQTRPASG